MPKSRSSPREYGSDVGLQVVCGATCRRELDAHLADYPGDGSNFNESFEQATDMHTLNRVDVEQNQLPMIMSKLQELEQHHQQGMVELAQKAVRARIEEHRLAIS